jgi:hypothetical protein
LNQEGEQENEKDKEELHSLIISDHSLMKQYK